MNKVMMFLVGVMMLVIVFIAMFFTGAIFDASRRETIETYFFQVNNYSYQRPGVPLTTSQLGDSKLFDLLMQKFVTEYLYVLPEVADIDRRESNNGALRWMSDNTVFEQWRNRIAPEIREMAGAEMLRTVSVGTPLKYGDFYLVEFELKTWQHPNNMDEIPSVQTGVMQLKVERMPELTQETMNKLHARIEEGYDIVGVFSFGVSDVIIHME